MQEYMFRPLGYKNRIISNGRSATQLTDAADFPDMSVERYLLRDSGQPVSHKERTRIFYVVSGEGFVEINGEPHNIEPGNTVLVKPFSLYRFMSKPGQTFDLVASSQPSMSREDTYTRFDCHETRDAKEPSKIYEKGLVIPNDFGSVTELTKSADCPLMSAAIANINDDRERHHDFTEIYYFMNGHGALFLNGKSHTVIPGSLAIITPGTRHRAVANIDGTFQIFVPSHPAYDSEKVQYVNETDV